jgi:hypothetical protein
VKFNPTYDLIKVEKQGNKIVSLKQLVLYWEAIKKDEKKKAFNEIRYKKEINKVSSLINSYFKEDPSFLHKFDVLRFAAKEFHSQCSDENPDDEGYKEFIGAINNCLVENNYILGSFTGIETMEELAEDTMLAVVEYVKEETVISKEDAIVSCGKELKREDATNSLLCNRLISNNCEALDGLGYAMNKESCAQCNASHEYIKNGKCHSCGEDKERLNGQCVDACPEGTTRVADAENSCVREPKKQKNGPGMATSLLMLGGTVQQGIMQNQMHQMGQHNQSFYNNMRSAYASRL